MNIIQTAKSNLNDISSFIPKAQKKVINSLFSSEERMFFIKKVEELKKIIEGMPKTYETRGQGENAIVYLHYFFNGGDFFITEKDVYFSQNQAFGLACCGYPELGYISIQEIINLEYAQLDLHWNPCSIRKVREDFL